MRKERRKHYCVCSRRLCASLSSQDKGAALKGKSILEVVQSATEAPVRNNGGGHYNHSYVHLSPPSSSLSTTC